jgi:3-methyladenine DNA glycosylase AlkC
MASELRDFFDEAVIRDIARELKRAHPSFRDRRFVAAALEGLAPLSLTGRAAHITAAMRAELPTDFAEAADILLRSLGPRHGSSDTFGMSPFKYLPHTMFVATHGLEHFEWAMRLQYELTQRFTAEFSIRTFLIHHPDATYARLRTWASDANVHVRRLVSEGSRPRLPWAQRLRQFQEDPAPVLALLELLKDDPELYVRRSVANSLNDIAKDHPELVVATAQAWLVDATPERAWIVKHALRSLVKQGHGGALALMGVGHAPKIRMENISITPARAKRGGSVVCSCAVVSASRSEQDLLVDYAVHYAKANASTSAKVFKLKRAILPSKGSLPIRITVKLADLTTRKHYPGRHAIDLLVNGRRYPLGSFTLAG